ncbi:MAG: lysophospholipid acyltransferase family protein [Planctomycetota bacterium]
MTGEDGAPPEPLRRRVRASLLRGLVRTAGATPAPALEGLLRPLVRAAFARRYAAVVRENTAVALPHLREHAPRLADEIQAAPRAFERAVARVVAEQGAHWLRLARGANPDGASGGWVEELVEVDPSIERLDAVLAAGRGAIVVTAHLGDWELLCARLRRRGHGGAVVGRVRRRDSSHRWLVDMRRAYGVDTLPQDAPARDALRVLRDGGVLGLLTDLRVKRLDGRDVPFFGVPARTMTAPAAFARAHRAPLVPIRCVQRPGDRGYRLSVDPVLELREDLGREDAAFDLLRRQNRVFERWIVDAPEQWAWHQRRWDVSTPDA